MVTQLDKQAANIVKNTIHGGELLLALQLKLIPAMSQLASMFGSKIVPPNYLSGY